MRGSVEVFRALMVAGPMVGVVWAQEPAGNTTSPSPTGTNASTPEALDIQCINEAAGKSRLNTICNGNEPLCGVSCQAAQITYITILTEECKAPDVAIPTRQTVNQCQVTTGDCENDFNDQDFFCSECGLKYVNVLKGRLRLDGIAVDEAFQRNAQLQRAEREVTEMCPDKLQQVKANDTLVADLEEVSDESDDDAKDADDQEKDPRNSSMPKAISRALVFILSSLILVF